MELATFRFLKKGQSEKDDLMRLITTQQTSSNDVPRPIERESAHPF